MSSGPRSTKPPAGACLGEEDVGQAAVSILDSGGQVLEVGEDVVAPVRNRRRRPSVQLVHDSIHYRRTQVGLALVALSVAVAIVGPYLAPHSPYEFVDTPFASPSATALLGTDVIGRDVLSRVLCGGRSVLLMALGATVVGVLLGTALGLLAGYAREAVDEGVMRVLDAVMSFPQIVLALLIVSIIGPRLWLIVLTVGVSHAPRVARVVRCVALEIKELDYVKAAESLGLSHVRIVLGEILPMLSSPLAVEFGLRMTLSIGIVAGLSFLGFGIQPPAPDWGLMLNENRVGVALQPFAVFAPVSMIAILTVGFNFVTDGFARAMIGIDRDTGAA